MDFSDQVSRLARAHQLGAALSADMQAWGVSTPYGVRASIAGDRLSWELRLQVSQSPPLADWGFRFGEAVNHLRAALDNLIVAIARQSGVTDEKQLKGLMFPICGTLKEWKSRQKALSCLPDWCREALGQVQPFQRPEHGGSLHEDLLLVLRDLDNSTKHHLQVKPDLAPQSIRHTGGAPIPYTIDPGRAEQTWFLASRSYVRWRTPPGRQEPRPLHGVWVDGGRDGSWGKWWAEVRSPV